LGRFKDVSKKVQEKEENDIKLISSLKAQVEDFKRGKTHI